MSGRSFPPVLRWLALIGLSVLFMIVLRALAVPASLFLAPMAAGIVLTVSGGEVRVPSWMFVVAQGLIGCMIANMLPAALFGELVDQWPLFLFGASSVIAISGFLGWLMARLHLLPGTTVVWGLSPGAAPAMIAMAENYGADTQFVALLQYLRVVMVAAIASIIAGAVGVATLHPVGAVNWFPPIAPLALAETLAVAASGPIAARLLRMPSLALLLPMFGGIGLTHFGWITISTPPWLLAAGYALVGWRVGLRFTRPLLVHAAKALPRMFVCTIALIALCGLFSGVLMVVAGIDPLTAYLAMSPGGADSIAIIAASTHVDAAFVMTMQTLRFLGVMLVGPAMARFVAAQVGAAQVAETPDQSSIA
jgi:membrane AbrB-like protein